MVPQITAIEHEVIAENCPSIEHGDVRRLEITVVTKFEYDDNAPGRDRTTVTFRRLDEQSDAIFQWQRADRETESSFTQFQIEAVLEAAVYVQEHYTDGGRVDLSVLNPLKSEY